MAEHSGSTGLDRPPVELVIPADTKSVRLARLVMSGVATAAGFDVEDIEDLRIAVDEVCAVLLDCEPRDVIRLTWRTGAGVVETTAHAEVATPRPPNPLSVQVLSVLADSVERAERDGTVSYRITRRREADVGG